MMSFPWKLNGYSYGEQFGINCTALDKSKLSNFVKRTIIKVIAHKIIILKEKWKQSKIQVVRSSHPLPDMMTEKQSILGRRHPKHVCTNIHTHTYIHILCLFQVTKGLFSEIWDKQ